MKGNKHKIGICGATGYTGLELVRLVLKRPDLEIVFLTSQKHSGTKFDQIQAEFRGELELEYQKLEQSFIKSLSRHKVDCVFFATPNGICKDYAGDLLEKNIHVIDLSADFRLDDCKTYQEWYGQERQDHELNAKAIYGLTEFNSELVKANTDSAVLIANPGCYTTASILALTPLLDYASTQKDFIDWNSIIIDGKSGLSGAGKNLEEKLLFSESNESCSPYKLGGSHRHIPELEDFFKRRTSKEITLSFSPHLIPMTRGLLVTCYVSLKTKLPGTEGIQLIHEIYSKAYSKSKQVILLEQNEYPNTKHVSNSNKAQVQANFDARTQRAILTCAIDNLGKGAAGQALENFELLMAETAPI